MSHNRIAAYMGGRPCRGLWKSKTDARLTLHKPGAADIELVIVWDGQQLPPRKPDDDQDDQGEQDKA